MELAPLLFAEGEGGWELVQLWSSPRPARPRRSSSGQGVRQEKAWLTPRQRTARSPQGCSSPHPERRSEPLLPGAVTLRASTGGQDHAGRLRRVRPPRRLSVAEHVTVYAYVDEDRTLLSPPHPSEGRRLEKPDGSGAGGGHRTQQGDRSALPCPPPRVEITPAQPPPLSSGAPPVARAHRKGYWSITPQTISSATEA
jgi:hypothetical protein